jgi:hypothetical protein
MAALKPRHGQPGLVVSYSDRDGNRRYLEADKAGLFQPTDDQDEEALDRGGFAEPEKESKPKADKAEAPASKPSADEPEEKES